MLPNRLHFLPELHVLQVSHAGAVLHVLHVAGAVAQVLQVAGAVVQVLHVAGALQTGAAQVLQDFFLKRQLFGAGQVLQHGGLAAACCRWYV